MTLYHFSIDFHSLCLTFYLVDAAWMTWQEWEDCSKLCGNGTRTRRRKCKNPMYNGKECDELSENDHQEEHCNLQPCKGSN